MHRLRRIHFLYSKETGFGTSNLKSIVKSIQPFDHRRSLANFYYASEQQLKNAITAALKAREIWSRTEFDTRARIFLKAADMISDQNRFQLLASTMLGQVRWLFFTPA